MIRHEFYLRDLAFRIEHTNGNHLRIMWELNGKPDVLVVPFSPSDWRGLLNARADLRRKLRGARLIGPER